jgi:hypothetical protein
MKGQRAALICFLGAIHAFAQPAPAPNPGSGSGSGTGSGAAAAATNPPYTPPTHGQRFNIYLWHTYGPDRIFEAAVWAGIDQADHAPRQWPEGAKGYAERFGSVMGLYAVRGTAEYALSEAFREDLRYEHCYRCSTSGKLKTAFLNTFAARKGMDGHEDFSMTRLLAPIPGGVVASTWLPGRYDAHRIGKEVGFTYAFDLAKNIVVALVHR